MRQNRLSERLKTKLDSFGFDALIHGVSTLPEEEAKAREAKEPRSRRDEEAQTAAPEVFDEPVAAEATRLATRPEPAVPSEAAALPDTRPAPLLSAPVLRAIEELTEERPAEPAPQPHPFTPKIVTGTPEQLRSALEGLSCQLVQEAGRLAAALAAYDAEEAGFHLSHLNQVLDLLRSIDPRGDAARDLGIPHAPPAGRAWPATAWSVVEFAESPFSALLPRDCGDDFVREMLYAAWGVSVEPVTA